MLQWFEYKFGGWLLWETMEFTKMNLIETLHWSVLLVSVSQMNIKSLNCNISLFNCKHYHDKFNSKLNWNLFLWKNWPISVVVILTIIHSYKFSKIVLCNRDYIYLNAVELFLFYVASINLNEGRNTVFCSE